MKWNVKMNKKLIFNLVCKRILVIKNFMNKLKVNNSCYKFQFTDLFSKYLAI